MQFNGEGKLESDMVSERAKDKKELGGSAGGRGDEERRT